MEDKMKCFEEFKKEYDLKEKKEQHPFGIEHPDHGELMNLDSLRESYHVPCPTEKLIDVFSGCNRVSYCPCCNKEIMTALGRHDRTAYRYYYCKDCNYACVFEDSHGWDGV